jgi:hypothetical protein
MTKAESSLQKLQFYNFDYRKKFKDITHFFCLISIYIGQIQTEYYLKLQLNFINIFTTAYLTKICA